ncbi:hypothetical protein chiPu_0016259 [Chiloscyllium punctatum]|uniref:Uncharacterized protein n=1 Tax=Chiloscyllium punctatum TaxID=137246 RepID=A0A401T501_CHIPU|nr:hypothetical protein [Chiloscyllium punctatum]
MEQAFTWNLGIHKQTCPLQGWSPGQVATYGTESLRRLPVRFLPNCFPIALRLRQSHVVRPAKLEHPSRYSHVHRSRTQKWNCKLKQISPGENGFTFFHQKEFRITVRKHDRMFAAVYVRKCNKAPVGHELMADGKQGSSSNHSAAEPRAKVVPRY